VLKIRTAQIQALRERIQERNRDQLVSDISLYLQQSAPKIMNQYTRQQHRELIIEVLTATEKLGIFDPEHLLNWSYIRFLTNKAFYRMNEFKDILDHPFLHGYGKGRHIVLAFFAISRMHKGSSY
jgi:hypothetical protein